MELTIFAKRRQSKEGKQFYQFLGTLKKKDGTDETMRVCFRDCAVPRAESCPRNIIITKDHCNIASRSYNDKDGNLKSAKTLWVSEWSEGRQYIDHSMDDYEID